MLNNENIRTNLEAELALLLEKLKTLKVGSEEHQKATEDLMKLYKVALEESKDDWDYDLAVRKRELEEQIASNKLEVEERMANTKLEVEERMANTKLEVEERLAKFEQESKKEQSDKQDKFQWINLGVTGGLGLLQLFLMGKAHRDILRFEETGTITSRAAQHVTGLKRLFDIKK